MAYLTFALLLAAARMTMFAQTPPVRAGDPAPQIDGTKVVQAPESTGDHPNLAGVFTVLQFLPLTPNEQAIEIWNELAEQFRNRPVQFIWIASESRPGVEAFLQQHPVKGWVLADERHETERAYGCDRGENAVVDPAGMIAGFALFLQPEQISGVLEGKKGVLKTAPDVLRPPPPGGKPDLPPSYEVHISPSAAEGTESSVGPDYWVHRGFSLKAMAAVVYGIEESRITAPKQFEDKRFNFMLVLPKQENEAVILPLVRRAIERYFNVTPDFEDNPADVYVLTALKDRAPQAKTGPDRFGGGSVGSGSFVFSLPPGTPDDPEAIQRALEEMMKRPEARGLANISAHNTGMGDFCRQLEMGLGRPVVDESGLEGAYDLAVRGSAKNNEEFFAMLREQTGLVLSPGIRTVRRLALR